MVLKQLMEWIISVISIAAAVGLGWTLKEVGRLSDIARDMPEMRVEMAEMRVEIAEYKAQELITQERYNNVREYVKNQCGDK